jgi:alkaline phosphatase D
LFPFIVTWDDHESANNSYRDGAENHTPGTEGDWKVRKANAMRAYSEWMPIRAQDPAVIYRALRYGDLLDFVVMDTRLEGRDPEMGTTGGTLLSPGIDDPKRQMISARQRTFVHDRLARSTSTWKVIAQQVILAQWNAGGTPRAAAGMGPFRNGGNALNPDQWDGYTAERDRLLGLIRSKKVSNVVVLTGDVHTSWANDLVEDPYDPRRYHPVSGAGALGVEFVTPSITSANFAQLGPAGVRAFEAATKADNPHVKFVNFDQHGYVVLDVTQDRVQADWFFVDTVERRSSAQQFAAAWQVRRGENHLRPATGQAPGGRKAPAVPTSKKAAMIPAASFVALGVGAKVLDRRQRLAP